MRIRTIVDEDFVNYKIPSMYIGTASCGGKCCTEQGLPLSVCQNDEWRNSKIIDMPDDKIIERYIKNDITGAICFSGLEPFEQFPELLNFIKKLRGEYLCKDRVIIYTGYDREEIEKQVKQLVPFENIIIKFGRYVPNQKKHYDDTLGVYLASDNQYAEEIC